eukprot:TRINITY_DN1470_c0_g2_i16.p1 TRINITY_DN1470_c0_g2~~TRINITY_DN1470_c0_g2_i16.p1  ORF type:complete len:309 (+),score=39.74 TRINITY_DN1470_c0_g2_i16:59-985(+)
MLAFGRHGLQSSELVAKSFTAVAASNTYSLALDDELQLWSWGHAPYGQHGHNREDVSEISLVKSVHVKSVSVSENFSVILDCEGRLFQAGLFAFDQSTQQPLVDCITQRDYRCPPHHSSQVIANFMEKSRKDILVATMATEIRSLPNRTWKKVVSGQMYLAILSESGELYMIGRFSFQPQALFTPFTMKQIQPPQGVTNWVDVASGWDHIIAIADTGCVYSWGWGYYGQLGIGEVKNSDLPILVDTLDGLNVSKIFCGPKSSACVTDTGDLYVFGDGSTHALGRSVDRIATCPELMEVCLSNLHHIST